MTTTFLVLGILLLVAALFLVVAVLMQSGKDHHLSGSIAGGADTFFGKTKGKTADRILSKLTTIVAIVFAILVVIVYIIQEDTAMTQDNYYDQNKDDLIAGDTEAVTTDAATEAETVAETAVTTTAETN